MTWEIDHIQLAIPPMCEAQARTFWIDLLGMTETPKPEALQPRGGLWLAIGPVSLHLGVENPFTPARKAHPCFRVPDLDRVATILNGAGYPVRWDDLLTDRRRFFTDDPFGNRIEFS